MLDNLASLRGLPRAPLLAALALLWACSPADGQSRGPQRLDPESRPTNGALAVDASGARVAALPAGRPLREISVYDVAAGQVLRLIDPAPGARYQGRAVVISRNGQTVYAIRRYERVDQYPDLVAIDLQSGRIRQLTTRAASFGGLAADPSGPSLYYLRDVEDRGPAVTVPSPDGFPIDRTGAGEFQRLVRIATDGRETPVAGALVLRRPARLAVTRDSLYVSAQGAAPAADGLAARQRFARGGYVGPSPAPMPYAPGSQVLLRGPLGQPGGAFAPGLRRVRPSDLGVSFEMTCAGAAGCDRSQAVALALGFGAEPSEDRFALADHQLSDDGATYFQMADALLCWGPTQPHVPCAAHRLDRAAVNWTDAVMAHDGRVAIVGIEDPSRRDHVRRWCRASGVQDVAGCTWRPESGFTPRLLTLSPAP